MVYGEYTVVLKTLMDDPECMSAINKAMSTYPLYEQRTKGEYIPVYIPTREELNRKILNRYKYREIGFETVGRFLDELEISLNEIMPYYNQMFYSVDQDYDVLYNVDYTRTMTLEREGEHGSETSSENQSEVLVDNTTTSDGSDVSKNVHSETPQGQLSVPGSGIDSVSYADDVTWNKSEADNRTVEDGKTSSSGSGSESTSGTDKVSETSTENTKGNYGVVSFQDLLGKYRDLIINVEQMILDDPRIVELFMLVY